MWHAGFICLQPTTLPNPTQNHPNKVNVMNVLWWSPLPSSKTPREVSKSRIMLWEHDATIRLHQPASWSVLLLPAPEWPLCSQGRLARFCRRLLVLSSTEGFAGVAKSDWPRLKTTGDVTWEVQYDSGERYELSGGISLEHICMHSACDLGK